MAVIYVYNPNTNFIETYYRGLNERMPYTWGTLSVREFRGNSNSNTLWTTRTMIDTWNTFRSWWGRPIYIGAGFKRIWEGGHGDMSQHYAGVALDIGQTLPEAQREALRAFAVRSGIWSYVEPRSIAPRWVHVDKRSSGMACATGGYPYLTNGSRGVYVFILQDALNALGYRGGGLDGVFGGGTRNALTRFQNAESIGVTGAADCATWIRLTDRARGIGRTPSVIG